MSDTHPSDEEKAKFYVEQSVKNIGYYDTLDGMTTGQHGANSADQALEKLSREFHEGVSRVMQNKREHGFSPIEAFQFAVDPEWPEWVKVTLAEGEHHVFSSGDPEFRDEEEIEYIEWLEEQYAVPR